MSLRALGLVAFVLALLLFGVCYLGLTRLGWAGMPEAPSFLFQNRLLETDPGTMVRLRSIHARAAEYRYVFGNRVVEPQPQIEKAPEPGKDPPEMPHMRVFVGSRRPDETEFAASSVSFPLLALMGARSEREWLEEVGPVSERQMDGTVKTMLRARYGHATGATVAYFYDPADPDPTKRGFGWVRMEMYDQGQVSEVLFASPEGHIRSR